MIVVDQIKPVNQEKKKLLKTKNTKVGIWKRLDAEKKIV